MLANTMQVADDIVKPAWLWNLDMEESNGAFNVEAFLIYHQPSWLDFELTDL